MKQTDAAEKNEDENIPYSQKYPGFVALRDAVFGERDEAGRLIAADPSLLEARNGLGETVLHFLAVENAQEAVAFLIERGANINTVNDFGDTPLMDAASLNYAELCRFLLRHGANPFYVSPRGDNALWSAARSSKTKQGHTEAFLLMLEAIGERDINDFVEDYYAEQIVAGKQPSVSPAVATLLIRAWFDARFHVA